MSMPHDSGTERRELLREIETLAASSPGLLEVWLFGSRANGVHHAASDWDLLVYARPEAFDILVKRKDLQPKDADLLVVRSSGLCQSPWSTNSASGTTEKRLSIRELEWQRKNSDQAKYTGRTPYCDKAGNRIANHYDLVPHVAHRVWKNRPCRAHSYLFDTNIFNRIIKGTKNYRITPGAKCLATSWQEMEIRKTNNPERRGFLLDHLRAITAAYPVDEVACQTTCWGAKWGSAWDRGGCFYNEILAHLCELQQAADKVESHRVDAAIIETCIFEGLIFVSDDQKARIAASVFDVPSIPFEQAPLVEVRS